MSNYNRVCAEINLEAIRENIVCCRKRLKPETKIMAVVKADSYGHGSVGVSRAIDSLVDAYAVATIEEGMELRNSGIKKDILILGYLPGEFSKEAIVNDISLTAFDIETVEEYDCVAKETGKKARIHLKVDTGMGRIGIQPDESGLEVAKEIARLTNVAIEGVFSHFSSADEEDKEFSDIQLNKYLSFCDKLNEMGITGFIRHISNSAAAISIPKANLDMVRLGIIMYGLYPSDKVERVEGIKPALSLVSRISFVKTVPAGTSISYGATYVTSKETVVATIPVGYADGYKRALSNKGSVIIKGKKAPIIGRVCMDQFMVDVSDIEGVKKGDSVTLIGTDGNESVTAEDIGSMTESFNYEIICDIGKRIPRIYKQDKQ